MSKGVLLVRTASTRLEGEIRYCQTTGGRPYLHTAEWTVTPTLESVRESVANDDLPDAAIILPPALLRELANVLGEMDRETYLIVMPLPAH